MREAFRDTLERCKSIPQKPSVRYKGLLLEQESMKLRRLEHPVIEVRNEDCLDACARIIAAAAAASSSSSQQQQQQIAASSAKVGLLNMASDVKPGGGVVNGARAQEEDVCRRTTLYPTLLAQRYPLAADEVVFTPDVKILKDSDMVATQKKNPPVIAGVVSAAAIRRPTLAWNGTYMPDDLDLMRCKIHMVLETFEYHGIDRLVLGAWGCGAFRNPPEEVAHLFHDALTGDRFAGRFKHVAFAILARNPSELRTLDVFSKMFGR